MNRYAIFNFIGKLSPFLFAISPAFVNYKKLRGVHEKIVQVEKKYFHRETKFGRYYWISMHYYIHAIRDVFIISYPKSGRTWLRFMLFKVLVDHYNLNYSTYLSIEKLAENDSRVPRIKFTHAGKPQFKEISELEKNLDANKWGAKKVIFLTRDPRDIIVSSYFQATKREKYFQGDISSFIRHRKFGVGTMLTFINGWYENRGVPKDFLLIKYEDLHKDTFTQLLNILNFIGINNISQKNLLNAVEFGKFDNMKRIEKLGLAKGELMLLPGDPNDEESYKVRKGRVGGYVNYLSEDDINFVNVNIRDILSKEIGYF